MGKKSRKKVKKATAPTKADIVKILMKKCDNKEEDILKAWDEFHDKHDKGIISKEDFLASQVSGGVTSLTLCFTSRWQN